MSNALARLRKTFGDELFVRTGTGMQPTPFGEQVPGRWVRRWRRWKALNQRSQFDPATSARRFAIAMTDVGEVHFMPALIERCRAAAPHVQLSSVRAGSVALKEELESGRVDLAVGPVPAWARSRCCAFTRCSMGASGAPRSRRGR